jgi:hypothetical protein
MNEHNFPHSQLNPSQRALMAARLINQGHSTCVEAAALLGISDDSLTRARIVLNKGTPEEIAADEPDVRRYRIRLSDWLHGEAHDGAVDGRRSRRRSPRSP